MTGRIIWLHTSHRAFTLEGIHSEIGVGTKGGIEISQAWQFFPHALLHPAELVFNHKCEGET